MNDEHLWGTATRGGEKREEELQRQAQVERWRWRHQPHPRGSEKASEKLAKFSGGT